MACVINFGQVSHIYIFCEQFRSFRINRALIFELFTLIDVQFVKRFWNERRSTANELTNDYHIDVNTVLIEIKSKQNKTCVKYFY